MKATMRILCSLLFFLWCFQATNGAARMQQRLSEEEHFKMFKHRAAARSLLAGKRHQKKSSNGGRVLYPIGYGADPTGVKDSTDAILKTVEDAFAVQKGKELLPGVNDLGGVVIELQGGDYKISRPIRFPTSGGGNIVIQGGSLRASETFPSDEYLVELWSTSSKRLEKAATFQKADLTGEKNPRLINVGVYYEDVTFRDILFDSGFRGGGLLAVDCVRTSVVNCFFMHFTTDGILVERGHEVVITDSFLGQIVNIGGDPRERNFSGTAIDLASNDNTITDVAIFSAATGVILRGQANMLTNVHCYNKATFWGGVGILVRLAGLAQTRIANSYMDFTGIVLEDPVQVHITNGFFLGNANIVLRSIKGQISGVVISDNMFAGTGWTTPIIELDESNGPFHQVDQAVIDRNNVLEMNVKSTVAQMTVAGKGKKWVADFSSILVFPNLINHVQYSMVLNEPCYIPAHAVTGVANNAVEIRAKEEVDAVVSVVVDQYLRPGEMKRI